MSLPQHDRHGFYRPRRPVNISSMTIFSNFIIALDRLVRRDRPRHTACTPRRVAPTILPTLTIGPSTAEAADCWDNFPMPNACCNIGRIHIMKKQGHCLVWVLRKSLSGKSAGGPMYSRPYRTALEQILRASKAYKSLVDVK